MSPGMSATINSNRLRVTISRDSFYLDLAYFLMLQVLSDAMMGELADKLSKGMEPKVALANQYILKNSLKRHLSGTLPVGTTQTLKQVVQILGGRQGCSNCPAEAYGFR